MWKYLYGALLVLALVAGISSVAINKDETTGGVQTIMNKLGVISKRKQAEVVMGLYKAQQLRLQDMQEKIDRDHQVFRDKQQAIRDQMLTMNNKVGLSTAEFTKILTQDLADVQRRASLGSYGGLQTMSSLRTLQDSLNTIRTQAAASGVPPQDQIALQVRDLKERVQNLSSSIDPNKALQYQQQLDNLNQLVQDRDNMAEAYRAAEITLRDVTERNKIMMQDAKRKLEDLNQQNSFLVDQMKFRALNNNEYAESVLAQQRLKQAEQQEMLSGYQRLIERQQQQLSHQQNIFMDHQQRIDDQRQSHRDRLLILQGR